MHAIAPIGLPVLLVAWLLAGCQAPPPEAYVRSAQATTARPVAQVSIGKNSVGEDCTQQAEGGNGAHGQ